MSLSIADIKIMIQTLPMKLVAVLALTSAVLCLTPAVAQTNKRSSAEDRQRFVSIVQHLEQAPLNPNFTADREWAIKWLTEAPDVSVNACLEPLAGGPQAKYPHGPEVVVQYILSMAAFIIQHPEKSRDQNAQQLAGVEGALTTYRSILKADPTATSPELEKLLAMRAQNELDDFVVKAEARCSETRGEQVQLP